MVTTVTPAAVGARLKAAFYNLVVSAIQELQAEIFSVPYLHMTNTTAVTNGADVQYNTVVVDSHSGWDSTNKRYVVPKSGDYVAFVQQQPNAAVAVGGGIRVNGVNRIAPGIVTNLNQGSGGVSGVMRLVAGDLVTVREFNGSYTPAGAVTNFLILRYIGPT